MIFWSFDHPAAGWRLASWLKEQSAAASAPPEHKRVTAAALALLDAMNGTTALTSRILWTALYETVRRWNARASTRRACEPVWSARVFAWAATIR
jgi:hypothetical protein